MQKISRPTASLGAPPCSAFSWHELDWHANGEFWVTTDDDPHGKLYLVTPDGQMIDVGCHADPETDVNRACWMADALNYFRALAISQDEVPRTPA